MVEQRHRMHDGRHPEPLRCRKSGSVRVGAMVRRRPVLVVRTSLGVGVGVFMTVITPRVVCMVGSGSHRLVVDLAIAHLSHRRLHRSGGRGDQHEECRQASEHQSTGERVR